MTMELFRNLLLLGAAGLGVGLLLGWPTAKEGKFYDERQRMEQGRAANIAMNTALAYLMIAYVALLLEWLPEEHLSVAMVFGLVLTMVVYRTYLIFRDVYLGQFSDPFASAGVALVFGMIWLMIARSRWNNGESFVWLNLMLCFSYTADALALFTRALYVRIRDRNEEEE